MGFGLHGISSEAACIWSAYALLFLGILLFFLRAPAKFRSRPIAQSTRGLDASPSAGTADVGRPGSLSFFPGLHQSPASDSDVSVGSSGLEPPPFAFAFDIDGVLLHVAKPIPGATAVLRFLNDYNIPFILLTNGGGKHETERVRDLGERLGVPLSTDNFVQSHTPFQELLEGPDSLRDKTVLVTGSDYEKCRAIFKEYGFQNVITPADIYAASPTIFPFQPASTFTTPTAPLPKPLYTSPTLSSSTLPSHLKVDAIFILNDPRDWALDTQIITDLLLSHAGHVGTYSPLNNSPTLPNNGWQRDGQPRLYFSNADLLWSAGYHLPRLGQGAFQAALAGLWRRITGGSAELERTSIGKPYGETYRFAERVLAGHRGEVLRVMGNDKKVGALRRVYMVGDNPESDIAGANGYVSAEGTEWVSVLVRTGVWSEERGRKLEGEFEPRVVVDDVMGAVKWAFRREGWVGGEELK
ncbi:HAD-like domain-containing protein [Parachaetomium inaequale]|uniref:HAD-like domain-containing protein n=1 Tax=Parachaetomium inaequale TaxID=2588326 RepID=A0AAN6PNS9_9PEZI|nr:HAD-like domain-containing protein [Parachaetomium inaequale]